MNIRQNKRENKEDNYSYVEKVWIAAGSVALLAILILIVRVAFNVLLMVVAGSLIAVYFHGLADAICRWTNWRRGICMLISVLGTFIIAGLLFWFMGSRIQQQVSTLSQDFPTLLDKLEQQVRSYPLGDRMLNNFSGDNMQKVTTTVQKFFRTSFGVIGDMYIIMFLGIFFTIQPDLYKKGIVRLIPRRGQQKARDVLDRLSFVLKGWLKGMMVAMVLIGVLTFVGLTIIGIPMALALAVIAGLLNFIPNFGPLMAMAPAVLLGLVDSTQIAIIVAALYILIQTLESNIITPTIQRRMIDLPPALLIIGQVMMGALSGALGIILATPLLAITMTLVNELYIKPNEEAEELIITEKPD
ncbi:AI-2E family transporter [Mucilaginibacter sp. RS28]|uniref:AI-2E family transporter n=1 Tax=Mucilaginibacter straminoryzae TaxID=2932774 RepID=A0A9X1X4T6_9SPHI|nr:AI-2E family transporter [Mucilaginibacter straminoryzae]MCJ8210576.1 AI-2E family transporter [Mucilaginibacter straminoryzae]